MPPKHLPKPRTWGTRYDSLGTSPQSPPSSPTHISGSAYNTRPSIVPSTIDQKLIPLSNDIDLAADTSGSVGEHPAPDATAHDASVFVGSLPSNVDHNELTYRLSDHLSGYSQIKGIKVIRDSRGGICAFVQCDNPSAAAGLLQALQANPPRAFLGRFLRFEPAKAYRTVLVSYRIPTGLLSADSDGLSGTADSPHAGLRLAHAMRIFRPRNAKYLSLLYDTDALEFDAGSLDDQVDVCRLDAFNGEGVLLPTLKYDEENMRRLATMFGPLEHFREYPVNGHAEDTTIMGYPFPHDAPRSAEMAKGVWEIKWKDREDSVTALLTLRRIPHLSVSWAHHPPSAGSSAGFRKFALMRPPAPWNTSAHTGRQMVDRTTTGNIPYTPCTPPRSLAHYSSTVGSAPTLPQRIPDGLLQVGGQPTGTTMRWADQVNELDYHESDTASSSTYSLSTSTPANQSVAASQPSIVPITPKRDTTQPQTPCSAKSATSPAGTVGQPVPGERSTGHTTGRNHHQPPNFQGWAREIDPTTVFVGNLDIPGYDLWDEGKLRRIFGHFGAIENVQIIRPLNKRSAFAFVKFVNTESAARAVREEHNKIHDGRPIRVQLRDRNPPPRGNLRAGRGRGRGFFGVPSQLGRDASLDSPLRLEVDGLGTIGSLPATPDCSSTPLSSPHELRSSSSAHAGYGFSEHLLRSRGPQDTSTSSLSSDTTKVPSLNNEVYCGPSSTVASPTPAPSSASASTSTSSAVPLAPYQVNMGFLPPQHWVQPYPTPYPYAVPILPGYGYAGYPYPPVHPISSAFFAPETPVSAGVSTSGPPWAVTNHTKECGPSNPVRPSAAAREQVSQPPLRATGFIQNEHGALIPVYQREALDLYMANAHGRDPPEVRSPQASASASGLWHQAPSTLPVYPGAFPIGVQAMTPLPVPPPSQVSSNQQHIWMPSPMGYGSIHPQSHPSVPPSHPHLASVPVSTHRVAFPSSNYDQPHVAQRSGHLPKRPYRWEHHRPQGFLGTHIPYNTRPNTSGMV